MEWDHPCHKRALLHVVRCFKEQTHTASAELCICSALQHRPPSVSMHSNCDIYNVHSAVYEQQQVNDSKGHCTAMQCSYWQLQQSCHSSDIAVTCSVRTVTPPGLHAPECAWHSRARGCSAHAHECICKQATHACLHATIAVPETFECVYAFAQPNPRRTKAYRRCPNYTHNPH